MKSKYLTVIIATTLLSGISLSSYASLHQTVYEKTSNSQQSYRIHSVDSGRVAFSSIFVVKRKTGYVVRGDARIKTMQRRILRLPGSVSIELKNTNGDVLESIKAKFHRKFAVSKAAHFDGTLRTIPPTGSTIVITHNR